MNILHFNFKTIVIIPTISHSEAHFSSFNTHLTLKNQNITIKIRENFGINFSFTILNGLRNFNR